MKNTSGFTIVELLVVIIVIGILSAIVVVAYNGVQKNAQNTALLSGMDALEKGLKLYAAEQGAYPRPTDIPGQSGGGNGWFSYACIQPTSGGWPVQDGLGASDCFSSNGVQANYVGYSSVVIQAIKSKVNPIPDTRSLTASFSTSGVTIASRGILYQYQGDPDPFYPQGQASLLYVIQNDQKCGRGDKTSIANVTMCNITLK
jgi:prepilin-type N-terminal cleavage/methylation domain-containing protein